MFKQTMARYVVAACLSTTAKVKITRGGCSHDAGIQALSWNSRREHNQPVEFDLKGRRDRVDHLYGVPHPNFSVDQPLLHPARDRRWMRDIR